MRFYPVYPVSWLESLTGLGLQPAGSRITNPVFPVFWTKNYILAYQYNHKA